MPEPTPLIRNLEALDRRISVISRIIFEASDNAKNLLGEKVVYSGVIMDLGSITNELEEAAQTLEDSLRILATAVPVTGE
jgi:hypothetical protein